MDLASGILYKDLQETKADEPPRTQKFAGV